ncbi:hypothetical protein ABH923_000303 [Leifsonia sp. EB41]
MSAWADPVKSKRMDQAIRHGVPRDKAKVPDSMVLSASQVPAAMSSAATTVNLSGVVQYASTYWQQYNPAYVAQSGDDCTNFASQALFAGGWTMNQTGNYQQPDQWWYNSGGGVAPQNQSWPWINAQMLSDFGGPLHFALLR